MQWGKGWVVAVVLLIALGLVVLSFSVYHLGYSHGFVSGHNNATERCADLIEESCPDLWSLIIFNAENKHPPQKIIYG